MAIVHFTVLVIHVVLAAFWAGSVFLMAIFLVPAADETGAVGGTVMEALTRRHVPRILVWVGVFTVLTGLYLLWLISHHFAGAFMGSPAGVLLSIGALSGIVALLLSVHLSQPTLKKMSASGATTESSGALPTPEHVAETGRLQRRLKVATRLTALALVVALVCMALGAHL